LNRVDKGSMDQIGGHCNPPCATSQTVTSSSSSGLYSVTSAINSSSE
jgi:hypothetical protein